MSLRLFVCIGLLTSNLFFSSPCRALAQGSGWEIETFDSKPENLEMLKVLLEAAPRKYDQFFETLGLLKTQDRKIVLKIFPTKESFKGYQQKNSQSKSDHAYFSLFNSEVVTWNSKNQDDLIGNLMHELTHDRVRTFISDERIPRCIDEGLAEIFEVAHISGSNISVGGVSESWRDLMKKAVGSSDVKPFGFFLEMTPREFISYRHPTIDHLQIAQCWAQSQFLYYCRSGEFRPFLKLMMEEGVKPGVLPDLYKKSKMTMPYSEMEEQWALFLKQL